MYGPWSFTSFKIFEPVEPQNDSQDLKVWALELDLVLRVYNLDVEMESFQRFNLVKIFHHQYKSEIFLNSLATSHEVMDTNKRLVVNW